MDRPTIRVYIGESEAIQVIHQLNPMFSGQDIVLDADWVNFTIWSRFLDIGAESKVISSLVQTCWSGGRWWALMIL